MMAATDLAVAVLWHMHQPDYVDSFSGRALMPWVRLHALLSYHDTLRVAREEPAARVNFNVTPVLLRQLEQLASGQVSDDFLILARAAPSELSGSDRILLLRRFFAFNHGRRFQELPRLAELWRKRAAAGEIPDAEDARAFTDTELRDLQVGFHLAWSGRTLREQGLVRALFQKGRHYTEGEKHELLDLQHEFLQGVLPAYRAAAADGQLEISCTPLNHPILPLLCDTNSAREAVPALPLPPQRFRWPADAWYQVQVGLDETERLLGVRPRGMWPAEGSLSEEAVRVFAAAGVRWLAGDEAVLTGSVGGSLPPGAHFRPYRWGDDGMPALFFRDHGLSDRIGFVYAGWPAARAVEDLVSNLQRIRQGLPAGPHLVALILDGENPWESYARGGVPFLQALYRSVERSPGLRWQTFSGFLADGGQETIAPLPRLRAGSWIRSDFTTWIGHAEKNAAWERLGEVRDWLEPRLKAAGVRRRQKVPGMRRQLQVIDPARLGGGSREPLARAWSALAAAEGSDWFWWYGDDNPSLFAAEFDELFRSHLMAVYRHLGEEPPAVLTSSLRAHAVQPAVQPPRYPLEIVLDGRVSSYFEWLDAGRCEVHAGGAMQAAEMPLGLLHFGAGPGHLYLRLDPPPGGRLAGLAGRRLIVRRLDEPGDAVELDFPEDLSAPGQLLPPQAGAAGALARGVYDRIVEIAIPWSELDVTPGTRCEIQVRLEGNGPVLVLPAMGALVLRAPLAASDADDWLV
jgi:alpha-amylase/alpha-mannosidase (GH57 family)